jgi:cytochrome P450
MRDATRRFVLDAIAQSSVRLSVTLQATELAFARLDKYIMPKQSMAGLEFVKFLRKLFRSRLENKTQSRDIFSFLQQCKDPVTGESLSARELSSETAIFLAAG